MAVKTFATGEVLTASDTNTYLNNGGLVYVTSTTLAASPSVGSVNITSCFSATYQSYLIVVNGMISSGAGGAGNITLLSGSTPITNGCYGNTFYVANGAAGALTNSPQTNSGIFEGALSLGTNNVAGNIWIHSPYLAKYTTCNFMNVDDSYMRMGTYVHRAATSYNGFQLNFGASTVNSGTITVYGARIA